MTSRCSISAALLTAVAATGSIAEAAPPARINHLAGATSFSEQDRADIQSYSEYWVGQLASRDPEEVNRANARLVDPLRAVRVSQVFRLQYAKAALPHLRAVIQNHGEQGAVNDLQAVNALQIAAQLGTADALEAIVAHASIADEPRLAIRLSAAKAFALAVMQDSIPPNEINPGLRQLAAAAAREEDWLTLQRQFEALAAVHTKVARDVQIEALQSIVQRIQQEEGPSDLMRALYPAVKLLFDEYIVLEPADKQTFGTALAPVLSDVCTVATKHWDGAQDDEEARSTYGGAVHISEQLLRLIDGHARPRQAGPRTKLGPAWKERDRDQFRADHDKWRAVLQRPPYTRS